MSQLLASTEPGHYLNWGVIQISVANLVVILLMVVVFAIAIWVPLGHTPEPVRNPTDEERRP